MATVRLLDTTFVERVWGTHALSPFFRDCPDRLIGEVWLTRTPPLPLLFKFLFTTDKLSVQVHPGGVDGKTEMWHVLRAEPDSKVAVGFLKPETAKDAEAAAISGEIEHMLCWWPVQPGDTVFVPAGTVHAIGSGITICEIQQNSDVTYRLFDYGRPRELHLEQGIKISKLEPHEGIIRPPAERLVDCEYFSVDRVSVAGSRSVRDCTVIALGGDGAVGGQPCHAGMAYYIEGETAIEGKLEAILARVPE